ncbi:MAG TPA: peptide ABC transporter substrate-binding protein [Candidatus Saccharimonadales bacterium]|nr:peptide ABC transporter substrate-binding protein [Candidatus Saccharimonadales bacterium]
MPKALKEQHKNIGEIGTATENTMERHFFRRLTNLAKVKRFVIGWLLLMSLLLLVGVFQFGFLRDKYQKLYFIPGGTFTEGIVGTYTNTNPIYAAGSVDSSVSKLLFSGLFSYGTDQRLEPDLAQSMDIDKTEKIYTVKLRDNLRWHDGQPLTAEDVVFTFKTIQNPDAQSYLLPSWKGIKVDAKDARTVVFELPNRLSSFPDSLTTGIIPRHLLKDIPPEQLRSNDFNTIHPVGSGPFKYDTVEVQKDEDRPELKREQIGLLANYGYYKGSPGIKRYIINTYDNQADLLKAYDGKKIDAVSGLGEINKAYADDQLNNIYSVPLAGQTLVFFKSSEGILADAKVRRALVLGANRQEIIKSTGQVLKESDEPLLSVQFGYDKKYSQQTGSLKQAQKILKKDGWKFDPAKGVRVKKGRELRINLYALDNNEYKRVTNELKKQWAELGVGVNISLQKDEDLKGTVSSRSYDALLSTISIGADPDVFAFWHSSQADERSRSRLNFSNYKSQKADLSLEAGRSRSSPKVRAIKYRTFLKEWKKDSPALALYQPNFTFIVRSPFNGFDSKGLISPIDRYSNVDSWMIRQQRR